MSRFKRGDLVEYAPLDGGYEPGRGAIGIVTGRSPAGLYVRWISCPLNAKMGDDDCSWNERNFVKIGEANLG